MEISKNSWHYRLANTRPVKISNNFCKYFWQVVLGCFVIIPWVLGGLATILFAGISPKEVADWILVLYGYGFITVLGFIVLIGYFLKKKMAENRFKKVTEGKTESNLFVQYIKAKKSKICPILTFVGDKNDD